MSQAPPSSTLFSVLMELVLGFCLSLFLLSLHPPLKLSLFCFSRSPGNISQKLCHPLSSGVAPQGRSHWAPRPFLRERDVSHQKQDDEAPKSLAPTSSAYILRDSQTWTLGPQGGDIGGQCPRSLLEDEEGAGTTCGGVGSLEPRPGKASGTAVRRKSPA